MISKSNSFNSIIISLHYILHLIHFTLIQFLKQQINHLPFNSKIDIPSIHNCFTLHLTFNFNSTNKSSLFLHTNLRILRIPLYPPPFLSLFFSDEQRVSKWTKSRREPSISAIRKLWKHQVLAGARLNWTKGGLAWISTSSRYREGVLSLLLPAHAEVSTAKNLSPVSNPSISSFLLSFFLVLLFPRLRDDEEEF